MAGDAYSTAVLRGFMGGGRSEQAAAECLGVGLRQLRSIADGRKALTAKQVKSIERTTGMTAGQLAASAMEPSGGPLTKLMDAWAAVRVDNAPVAAAKR